MEIERRHRRIPVGYPSDAGHAPHHPRERRRHGDDHARAPAGQQRQVAQELQRVAEALLLHHQHGPPGKVGQARQRRQQAVGGQHAAAGFRQDPVLVLPGLGEPPGVQSRDGAIHPDLPVVRLPRQCLVIGVEARVELALDLQHHAEIAPEHRLRGIERHRHTEPLRRLGEPPGLRQRQPHLVMGLSHLRRCAQQRFQHGHRGSGLATPAQQFRQAVAQPGVVRHQHQARAVLRLDQRGLLGCRQHPGEVAARMRVLAVEARDAVQQGRGRIRLALRAERKTAARAAPRHHPDRRAAARDMRSRRPGTDRSPAPPARPATRTVVHAMSRCSPMRRAVSTRRD